MKSNSLMLQVSHTRIVAIYQLNQLVDPGLILARTCKYQKIKQCVACVTSKLN